MYVCTYVHTYVHAYVYMYVCMYVCMYVRTYVRMYVRTYVCMYYVHMYICILSGSAPVTNGMATVTVHELRCNTLYTIKAGGTLNRRLLGPRLSHADISTTVCGEVVARNKDDGGRKS